MPYRSRALRIDDPVAAPSTLMKNPFASETE
jgi:hypothetical protein